MPETAPLKRNYSRRQEELLQMVQREEWKTRLKSMVRLVVAALLIACAWSLLFGRCARCLRLFGGQAATCDVSDGLLSALLFGECDCMGDHLGTYCEHSCGDFGQVNGSACVCSANRTGTYCELDMGQTPLLSYEGVMISEEEDTPTWLMVAGVAAHVAAVICMWPAFVCAAYCCEFIYEGIANRCCPDRKYREKCWCSYGNCYGL